MSGTPRAVPRCWRAKPLKNVPERCVQGQHRGTARGVPDIIGGDRVRTWVWAKLFINAVRILKHKDLRHP